MLTIQYILDVTVKETQKGIISVFSSSGSFLIYKNAIVTVVAGKTNHSTYSVFLVYLIEIDGTLKASFE